MTEAATHLEDMVDSLEEIVSGTPSETFRELVDRKADARESRRPALVKLVIDVTDLEQELLDGFQSRRDVLEWSRRLTVRTLGEVPTRWYLELARQFRGLPSDGRERALMSALLVPAARERALDEDAAAELRARIAAEAIRPAAHRALRQLRADAGEYLDDGDADSVSKHDPRLQRFIAMRPALDELEAFQQRALSRLLSGFDSREQIMDWGSDLELASHGEVQEKIVERAATEPSTRRMLMSDRDVDERARELFAARYLVPAYNRGVRDLAGRTAEQPETEVERTEPVLA
jgi:hypothetical protein